MGKKLTIHFDDTGPIELTDYRSITRASGFLTVLLYNGVEYKFPLNHVDQIVDD